jgi:uncharacterized membrane protein
VCAHRDTPLAAEEKVVMAVLWIVLLAVLVVVLCAVVLAKTVNSAVRTRRRHAATDPREALDRRFARAEIDAEEYTRRLAEFHDHGGGNDPASTPWNTTRD